MSWKQHLLSQSFTVVGLKLPGAGSGLGVGLQSILQKEETENQNTQSGQVIPSWYVDHAHDEMRFHLKHRVDFNTFTASYVICGSVASVRTVRSRFCSLPVVITQCRRATTLTEKLL